MLQEEELANITGLVYVIDAANQRSFGKAAELLQKLLLNEQCRKAKLMVMANKQDLGDAVQVAELSQALSLTSLRGQQWTIQGSSAMRGAYTVRLRPSLLQYVCSAAASQDRLNLKAFGGTFGFR
eukprot:SAG11_NODE_1572_length_4664_cov_8.611172_4_plen_125_part_00